jgi:hypothetical protein
MQTVSAQLGGPAQSAGELLCSCAPVSRLQVQLAAPYDGSPCAQLGTEAALVAMRRDRLPRRDAQSSCAHTPAATANSVSHFVMPEGTYACVLPWRQCDSSSRSRQFSLLCRLKSAFQGLNRSSMHTSSAKWFEIARRYASVSSRTIRQDSGQSRPLPPHPGRDQPADVPARRTVSPLQLTARAVPHPLLVVPPSHPH